ncbi:MAG: TonB-dependent receptor [Methylocystis sp.]|uniref:TonB-dependent receptor n=1 Tax=Methylocystis sp. TaxID=1911079 RepID=UPI003DA55B5C
MTRILKIRKRNIGAVSAGVSVVTLLLYAQGATAQTNLPPITIGASGADREPSAVPESRPSGDVTPKTSPIIGVVPDSPSTTYRVDARGIQLATGGGGANPIRAVGYLPSVDAPAIDPYGLANLPGSFKGIRIRGEVSQHGNSITLVDGLPINGINPGPGSTMMIDSENLSRIDLYQGPVPSNVNSYFTLPGVIDTRIRWSSDKFGAEVSQSVGSASFLRTFARIDSGAFLNGTTKFFLSGSWTDAHAWRGPGKAPQGKAGFAVGIETRPTDFFEAKVFIAKSNYNANTYAGLNYNQVRSLDANRFYNFLPVSSRIPALAVNYYNYNLQSFDSWMALGEFTVKFNDAMRLVVKPYYFREDGYYLDGMANGMVRNWLINHDSFGVTSELQARILETDVTLGHWYGVQNLPGPPTAWKMYAPNVLGGLTNPNWAILARQTGSHVNNSAYGTASRDFGPLHATGGVRYNWETMAGIDARTATGLGAFPYDMALALSPSVIPARSVDSFTVGTFLPFGALAYDVTKDLQLRVSAGGGYGGPSFDVWPAYQQNSATFLRNGISANQVWRAMRPETSAMVDVGARWTFNEWIGSGYVQPTVYYSRNHNKAVIYDPGIGTPYGQNVGESENYGAQALGQFSPIEGIDLFGSIGYQRAVFVQDLPSFATASLLTRFNNQVKGRQLPDVPYWISTVGSNLRVLDFIFTPIVHIVSSRSGDTTGLQPIAGYATLDLNFGYERNFDFGTLNASLAVMNIFDTAYIGQISNGYYQQTSSSGIYFPGAPRTVMAKVGYRF